MVVSLKQGLVKPLHPTDFIRNIIGTRCDATRQKGVGQAPAADHPCMNAVEAPGKPPEISNRSNIPVVNHRVTYRGQAIFKGVQIDRPFITLQAGSGMNDDFR